jgi:hypothetical protein
MSFEASLDRYLMEHKGERIHINLLTKRFNSLPNTIIHKLKLFHWRPWGGDTGTPEYGHIRVLLASMLKNGKNL